MIGSAGGYSAHLGEAVRMTDGTRFALRPILPSDAGPLHAFFRALSPRSRYFRFMTRLNELPEGLAERFTRIDYNRHLALVATRQESGREIMLGEARYVVDEGDGTTCELAITVADAWHRSGVALALLGRLEHHAAAFGFRRMVADTMLANEAMLGLARRCDYAVTAHPGDRTLARLCKLLPAETAFCLPPSIQVQ
jgi:acetyltransferase